jgi:7-cyano-7-deazaguanine reductase
MKHLHEKNEQYSIPGRGILDTFPAPGPGIVELTQKEFTSLCPLTKQPDYATIQIVYKPQEKCVESKSLKLYLAAYRGVGAFAEEIAERIYQDLNSVLDPMSLIVQVNFVSRGGISITTRRSSDD